MEEKLRMAEARVAIQRDDASKQAPDAGTGGRPAPDPEAGASPKLGCRPPFK